MGQVEDERREARGPAIHVVSGLSEAFVLALKPSVSDSRGCVEDRIERRCFESMTFKQQTHPSHLVARRGVYRRIPSLCGPMDCSGRLYGIRPVWLVTLCHRAWGR